MDRRTFLIRVGGTVVGTLALSVVAACGEDDDGGTGTGDNGNIDVEVELVDSHRHSLSLNRASLTRDMELQLTMTGGHDHDLTLDASEVNELLDGNAVTKDSSSMFGHVHEVTFTP